MFKIVKSIVFLMAIYSPSIFACTFSISNLNFGVYNPVASGNTMMSSNIVVTGCLLSLLANFKFTSGNSNNYAQRYLTNSSPTINDTINYNLYTDTGRTQIWGDGTQGSTTYYQLLAISLTPYNIPIYGKLIGQQAVAPGNYTDTIQLFITF